MCRCPRKLEDGVTSPRTGVKGSFKSPDIGARAELQSSERISACKCQTISLVPCLAIILIKVQVVFQSLRRCFLCG